MCVNFNTKSASECTTILRCDFKKKMHTFLVQTSCSTRERETLRPHALPSVLVSFELQPAGRLLLTRRFHFDYRRCSCVVLEGTPAIIAPMLAAFYTSP